MRGQGFPDGARCTPVPDLLFSRHLPELASTVAIKVLLHVLWRIHRRPAGSPPALRADGVAADPTLRRGVAVLGVAEDAIGEAVGEALDKLVEGGLLLAASVAGEAGPARWIFVNGREGRRAYRRWQDGGLVLPEPAAAVASGGQRPNVFVLYEENIGLLTPLLTDELRDAEATFPADWIEDAFRLAVEHNARSWAYARAILDRWAREGRDDEADRRGDQAARERDIEGPYASYIEH